MASRCKELSAKQLEQEVCFQNKDFYDLTTYVFSPLCLHTSLWLLACLARLPHEWLVYLCLPSQ